LQWATLSFARDTSREGEGAHWLKKLRAQPGKHINGGASGTLVSFLLANGLLDELQLRRTDQITLPRQGLMPLT
jgi:hypothetical protein